MRSWNSSGVLYGECKWRRESALNEGEVKKLFRRELATRSGRPLQPHYLFFSRAGFTGPAQDLAASRQSILVDLNSLDEVLAQAIR
jgi:hypothetical protein